MPTKLVSIMNTDLRTVYFLLGFVWLVGSGCAETTVEQPVDTSKAVLSEHQWVLSTVSYRGENKVVDALKPTYFQFDTARNLLLITTPCEGSDDFGRTLGYEILFQNERHYTLNPQDSSDVGCGRLINVQTEHLRVLDTSQYEIRDNQLFLIGEQVQIVLSMDDMTP